VKAELFHADRQTDIMKLTVTSHNFANDPKNGTQYWDACQELTQWRKENNEITHKEDK
jgi:hypothetical protein